MIFVGRGALLRRAVDFTLSAGHRVDLVCSDGLDADVTAVRFLHTTDINVHADAIREQCTDGIIWSIDNRMLFRAPLLDSGLRIYNIHNGLLPQHRGLPSVAVLFALLHGHTEYGATLHEVDQSIDTGRVLAEQRFAIGPDARYHQVLLRGVQTCQRLFERCLSAVVAGLPQAPGTTPARPTSDPPPGYYGLRTLRDLRRYTDDPAYARATDLGVTAAFVPEVEAAIARAVCAPGVEAPSACARSTVTTAGTARDALRSSVTRPRPST
ncbi:formyltransferase family protein [Streptomyces sp. NPDC094468]|uniref:formyltransferase family protein n=1 Tax=Streptomyces sp. NPDC094468 TaxID=3366066 RepID=UPI0037F336DC